MISHDIRSDQGDRARQLVEIAIQAGRAGQSPITKFVHGAPEINPREAEQVVSIYDNFLYVLALLRSRARDSFTEAKPLIMRLLAFQDPESGHFPRYLHEYPNTATWKRSLDLLIPLYWISRQFGLVLGSSLRASLTQATERLYRAVEQSYNEATPTFRQKFLWHAIQVAYGRAQEQPTLVEGALERLRSLVEEWAHAKVPECFDPKVSGELLAAWQLVDVQPPELVWERWIRLWHPTSMCYVGPARKDVQAGEEPEVTLYDLYCSFAMGVFSHRALIQTPYLLRAALVMAFNPPPSPSLPYGIEGENWCAWQTASFGYSVQELPLPPDCHPPYLLPYKMAFGGENRTHTLVGLGGKCGVAFTEAKEGSVQLLYQLPEEIAEKGKNHEICFYCDHSEELQLLVGEKPATLFQLGEELLIKGPETTISLRFSLEEGEGTFTGHIHRGNRPTQKRGATSDEYALFDWKISLRTVSRAGSCRIRVEVEMKT